MKQLLLAPIALILLTAPVSLVVFHIIPHAGFVATFATGAFVGATAMAFAGFQLIRIIRKADL